MKHKAFKWRLLWFLKLKTLDHLENVKKPIYYFALHTNACLGIIRNWIEKLDYLFCSNLFSFRVVFSKFNGIQICIRHNVAILYKGKMYQFIGFIFLFVEKFPKVQLCILVFDRLSTITKYRIELPLNLVKI